MQKKTTNNLNEQLICLFMSYKYKHTHKFVDRIIDVQLMMKSLLRQSKKCDAEERMAKTKAKTCYRQGDIERARIYAETAVLKRKQSQHYQMLNARLSPILSQLKVDFANGGGGGGDKTKELRGLLQEITTLSTAEKNFEVSQNDINTFIEQLKHDQSTDITYATPVANNYLADIEQRLANLRRKSPDTPE